MHFDQGPINNERNHHSSTLAELKLCQSIKFNSELDIQAIPARKVRLRGLCGQILANNI
jgi:hypothetical protein